MASCLYKNKKTPVSADMSPYNMAKYCTFCFLFGVFFCISIPTAPQRPMPTTRTCPRWKKPLATCLRFFFFARFSNISIPTASIIHNGICMPAPNACGDVFALICFLVPFIQYQHTNGINDAHRSRDTNGASTPNDYASVDVSSLTPASIRCECSVCVCVCVCACMYVYVCVHVHVS